MTNGDWGDRSRWQARALEQPGPGVLVRTRGMSGPPLWWFRSRDEGARESDAWQQLFHRRDWMPGRFLVIAMPNPHLASGALQAALRFGLKALVVSDLDVAETLAEIPAAYLIAAPLTAYRLYLRGLLDGLRELWLTGDVTGQGALQQRLGEFLPDLVIRDLYLLAEYPGPLAMSCAAGRWHWLNPESVRIQHATGGLATESGSLGVVHLCVDDRLYETGDVVTRLGEACVCGEVPGFITSAIWGRVDGIRAIGPGWLAPSHVAQAWYRSEGMADRLRATLVHDAVRQRDVLEVEAAVLEGYDIARTGARFQELLERGSGTAVAVTVREAKSLFPPLTIQLADDRGDVPDVRTRL